MVSKVAVEMRSEGDGLTDCAGCGLRLGFGDGNGFDGGETEGDDGPDDGDELHDE